MKTTTTACTAIPIKINCHFIRILLLALAVLCCSSIVHGETNSLCISSTTRMPFVVDSSKLLLRCGGDGDGSNQSDDDEKESTRVEKKDDACDHDEKGESQVIQEEEDGLEEQFEGNIMTKNSNVEGNEDAEREQDDILEDNASVDMETEEEDPMEADETRILDEDETQTDSFVSPKRYLILFWMTILPKTKFKKMVSLFLVKILVTASKLFRIVKKNGFLIIKLLT